MNSRHCQTLVIIVATLGIPTAARAETDTEMRTRILTQTKMNLDVAHDLRHLAAVIKDIDGYGLFFGRLRA
jgi:hypothetical protein